MGQGKGERGGKDKVLVHIQVRGQGKEKGGYKEIVRDKARLEIKSVVQMQAGGKGRMGGGKGARMQEGKGARDTVYVHTHGYQQYCNIRKHLQLQ